MKRLRSRLIAAFLGVAFLAMIPLAVVPYYTLQIRNQKVRTRLIENTLTAIQKDINYYSNAPSGELFYLAQYLQERFPRQSDFLELLEYADNLNDPVVRGEINRWEGILWDQVHENWVDALMQSQLIKQPYDALRRYRKYPIQIVPKQPYLQIRKWMEENLFYEEDNRIYCCVAQDLFKGEKRDEMELVGGLFLKTPLIEKFPKDPSQPPLLNIQKQYYPQPVVLDPQPMLFERYLSKEQLNKLFGFAPNAVYQDVDVSKVEIAADDTRWPPQFRLAPSNETNPASVEGTSVTVPMQMKLIPIINQRHEVSAIMALGVPITSIWDTLGFSVVLVSAITIVVIVLAAIQVGRTISRPINELVFAARRMSDGDFDVRVRIMGSEEQRILSYSFNQLAERIQNQLDQLRRQTSELEISNRQLFQTQRFMENILSNIQTGVMSVDPAGRISHINQVGEKILRVEEWRDRPVESVVHSPTIINLVAYSLRQSVSVQQNEIPYEVEEGLILSLQVSTVPILESGELKGLVVTFHDLSEIRSLEEQVRRQDRLAALGRMAAGVAHEIRNPLGIILGSAELLRKRFGGKPGEEGLTDFILEEVRRLSRVVNDFLQFARPPEPNTCEVHIAEMFEELTGYLEKQPMGEQFHLKTVIEGEPPPVAVDMHLCRQVFLNLFLNAQEAMPEGGTITLTARAVSVKDVAIEMRDEGMGIPPDRMDKIFDPFFTSKESGTGLGLSLVHQIVSSHKGRIEVDSTPGEGTIFRLFFPVYRASSLEDSYTGAIAATIPIDKTSNEAVQKRLPF